MYQLGASPRIGTRKLDLPTGMDPALSARLALLRVRKLLCAFAAGMSADPLRLTKTLSSPFTEPPLERERLFALGWLGWLAGDPAAAVPLLSDAERRCREAPADEPPAVTPELPALEPGLLLARCAYWGARVRLLLDQGSAVGDYEAVMRKLGGNPQATAWYVDLLWRAGKVDRAEQVWKSVRVNKRVLARDEGPLLDARAHLRKGELGPAEKLLREATVAGGVGWVERQLLLAWALSGMRQHDKAAELLQAARQGPYPSATTDAWLLALTARKEGRVISSLPLPVGWRDFVQGQQARSSGKLDEAEAHHRRALETPASPFARFALVCLGREDAAALLPTLPVTFFAVRLRVRQAVDRFLRRELPPGELLDAVRQARGAGYQPTGIDHYVRLAELLQQRMPALADLSALVATEGVEGTNFRRAAFELSRRLPPAGALALLRELARRSDEAIKADLGRALFGLAVAQLDAAALEEAAALLPDEPLVAQARSLLAGGDVAGGPAADLWRIAGVLASGTNLGEADGARLRELQGEPRWRPVASTLLVHDAAARNDVNAVAALLEQADNWRGLRTPPASLARTVAAVVATQPGNAVWARCLPGWLGLWPATALEKAAPSLLTLAGRGPQADAPAGIDAVGWFLHQAAAALRRNDARAALANVEKLGDLERVAEAEVVRPALPSLQRLAAAQALAACVAGQGETLAGLIDALTQIPEGETVLRAAASNDRKAALAGLGSLVRRTDLPGELSHHLALTFTRLAENGDPGAWRLAWPAWLSFLGGPGAPPPPPRDQLLDHLLGLHRRRVNDLLARGAYEPARTYWDAAQSLPTLSARYAPALADDLTARAAAFRDTLATEYLVTTREAMRFGQAGEGLKADYEAGLTMLRRLLSLDGENVRLLTALVETWNEWFLDLYHLQDRQALREQVARHVPFATQLMRLVGGQSSAHAARAALSDFYKVRGFVETDRARKIELYREALALNPANGNVRDLLAEMDQPQQKQEAPAAHEEQDEESGDE